MDGGPNNPLQKAAVPLLEPEFVEKDALALQSHFREKRDYMVRELEAMGIAAKKPKATFYIWADVSALPPPLNNCVVFFEYCIRHKVICVPGSAPQCPYTLTSTALRLERYRLDLELNRLIPHRSLLRREPVPPAPLPQVAVHRQAAHVVRARVAEPEAGRQGHARDHRARAGGDPTAAG